MSAQQQSPIRFQIEESVWLDHHADAANIVSLELEPEVSVTEEDRLVHMTGYLVLTGRFLTEDVEDDSLDLESSSLTEQLQFRPLKVDQKEIYQSEFKGVIEKRFPVDVTVPAEKVQRLDDVHVEIEQFDYSVSDGHRLDIQADIALRGVENGLTVDNTSRKQKSQALEKFAQASSFEVSASKDKEDQRGTEEDDPFWQEQDGPRADASSEDWVREPVSADQKRFSPEHDLKERDQNRAPQGDSLSGKDKREEADRATDQEETVRATDQKEPVRGTDEKEERVSVDDAQRSTADKDASAKERKAAEDEKMDEKPADQAETSRSAQGNKAEEEEIKDQQEEQVEEANTAKNDGSAEKVVDLFETSIRTNFNALPETDSSESVETRQDEMKAEDNSDRMAQEETSENMPQTSENEQKDASQTASFLTQLMSGEEEEDTRFTRLKMCIIQRNETLEDIAERYDVPVEKIVLVNRLDSEQVYAGQILYIP